MRSVREYRVCLLILSISESIDAPYHVIGGIFREEAILLLRRFYVQENEKGKGSPSTNIALTDVM